MKKRKLVYVPGIISLLGLPLLLLLFGPEDKMQERLINFHLPTPVNNSNENIFSEQTVYNSIKHKKIEQIDLDDYVYDEREKYLHENKMEFIRHEIERLQFTHDTSVVVKVRFGDRDSYGDYVKIVNLALIYRIKRYALVNDDLYFLANPPPPKPVAYELNFFPENDLIIPNYTPPSKYELILREIKIWFKNIIFQIKHNFLLFCGFILLIIIPSLINLFRKRNLTVLE